MIFNLVKPEGNLYPYVDLPSPITEKEVCIYADAAGRAGMEAWISHRDDEQATQMFIQASIDEWTRSQIALRFTRNRRHGSLRPHEGWCLAFYRDPDLDQIESFLMFVELLMPARTSA